MKALIVVDLQKDFCSGGATPVPGGSDIIPLINDLQNRFDVVAATKDWHPRGHISFASTHGRRPGEAVLQDGVLQVLWAEHCVQGTPGADFAEGFNTTRVEKAFLKGTDSRLDGRSGFFDNDGHRSTGLDEYLRLRSVTEVYVAGPAPGGAAVLAAPGARPPRG